MTCTCQLTLGSISGCLGQNNLKIINLFYKRSQEHQTNFQIMLKCYISLGSNWDLGWFGEFPHIDNSILVLAVNCCTCKHNANYVSKLCSFVDILFSKSKKCAVQKLLDICFLRFKWKIANIFARLWKLAQFCHWAIFPCSAANFRPADRWNRKSQIIPKLGRILKLKPQQCYNLIKTLLQTENEGRLGFELRPRFADFARFFCAFALKYLFFNLLVRVSEKQLEKGILIIKEY